MSKVLLINPPWIISEEKNLWQSVGSRWPSLGLAYIASTLEAAGHQVWYLDYPALNLVVLDTAEVLKSYGQAFDFIGLSATTPLIDNALKIAAIAKKSLPGAKIVFGGVHPSILPDEIIGHPAVDYVVIDEGEATMRDLADGIKPESILGLCYKIDGRAVKNPPRPLIKSLDDIPPPAYHLLPMDKYYPAVGSYKRSPVMIMFATRGCVGRCTFCYRTFRGLVRRRSARNIINEIKILQRDYGIKEVAFYDDTFTLFKEVVFEFCQIIKQEKIDLTWSCFTRADQISEALLLAMKGAGCHLILFGVESADEQILKNVNKNISLPQVISAVKIARQAGIETRASFMIGNQGETEASIKKTIDFAIKLDPDEVQFNIATPYPGTEFFSWAKANGYIKNFSWINYSMSNVVLELPGLSREKLQSYYELAHRRFYFRVKIIFRRLWHIRSWRQLWQEISGGIILFKLFLKQNF